jgi:hypothetical protein
MIEGCFLRMPLLMVACFSNLRVTLRDKGSPKGAGSSSNSSSVWRLEVSESLISSVYADFFLLNARIDVFGFIVSSWMVLPLWISGASLMIIRAGRLYDLRPRLSWIVTDDSAGVKGYGVVGAEALKNESSARGFSRLCFSFD